MELINVYGCSYCSMVSRRKGSVKRHESHHCRKNPARITCKSCKHMSYEEGGSEEIGLGQVHYEPSTWFCLKKDEDLNSPNLNENIECSFYETGEL